jgi:hypothetical protein
MMGYWRSIRAASAFAGSAKDAELMMGLSSSTTPERRRKGFAFGASCREKSNLFASQPRQQMQTPAKCCKTRPASSVRLLSRAGAAQRRLLTWRSRAHQSIDWLPVIVGFRRPHTANRARHPLTFADGTVVGLRNRQKKSARAANLLLMFAAFDQNDDRWRTPRLAIRDACADSTKLVKDSNLAGKITQYRYPQQSPTNACTNAA